MQAAGFLSQLAELGGGSPEVRVAVIDGPVALGHSCFAGASLELLSPTSPPSLDSDTSHGTAVASLLFGQDPAHPGAARRCHGLLLPVLYPTSQGLGCTETELASALRFAVDAGAHVINVSAGGAFRTGDELREAVAYAHAHGALVIAAAGNHGVARLDIPADLPGVLAVGAHDAEGTPLPGSNFDAVASALLAPGWNLEVATPDGRYGLASGTSFATALVSGAAAAILSRDVARVKPLAVGDALLRSSLPCDANEAGPRCLQGRAQPLTALRYLMESTETSPTQRPASSTLAEPIIASSSACACGGEGGGGLVYALGSLTYDVPNAERGDSLRQQLGFDPNDRPRFLACLADSPWLAESVTWVLTVDDIPVYALRPSGSYAANGYARLSAILTQELSGQADICAIPGRLQGSTPLSNGATVNVVVPELRGVYSWSVDSLVKANVETPGAQASAESAVAEELGNFLGRVYFELRNPGRSPAQRAMNYAATNAYLSTRVFEDAYARGMVLANIQSERSPIQPPDGEAWDVRMTFFDPQNQLARARRVYRYTIDVSDVVPFQVGAMRSWYEY